MVDVPEMANSVEALNKDGQITQIGGIWESVVEMVPSSLGLKGILEDCFNDFESCLLNKGFLAA